MAGGEGGARRIQLRPQESSERICPYCRDALRADEPEAACPTCDTRHHSACWAEAGRCATCPKGRARTAPRPVAQQLGPALRELLALLVTLGAHLARAVPPAWRLLMHPRGRPARWLVLVVGVAFVVAWAATRDHAVHARPHPARPVAPPRPAPALPPPKHPAPPAPDLRTFVNVGERLTYRIGVSKRSLERWTVTHVDAKEVRYTITPLTLDERPNGNERTGRWGWAPTWVALYHDPGPVERLDVGGLRVASRHESIPTRGGRGEWILLDPDGTTNLFPGSIKSVSDDGVVYSELVKIEGAPPALFVPPAPAPVATSPTALAPAAAASPHEAPFDLRTHIRVGQRYTFRTPYGTRTWRVTGVQAREVQYVSTSTLDGRETGQPVDATWWWALTYDQVVNAVPGRGAERLVLGEATFECAVAEVDGKRVWVPLSPDGSAHTFPGKVKVFAPDGSVQEELVAAEGPGLSDRRPAPR